MISRPEPACLVLLVCVLPLWSVSKKNREIVRGLWAVVIEERGVWEKGGFQVWGLISRGRKWT